MILRILRDSSQHSAEPRDTWAEVEYRITSVTPDAAPSSALDCEHRPRPATATGTAGLCAAVAAADELWSAFHRWLRILEHTAATIEAGLTSQLQDGPARLDAATAAAISPWHDQLDRYFAVFDHARRLLQTWTTLDMPPIEPTHRDARSALRDARTTLADLAGFLFTTLTKSLPEHPDS